MTLDEQIAESLDEIRAMLRVIASEKKDQLLEGIASKSQTRKKMFGLFNGKLTLTQIAARTDTSTQAVQQFADDCESKGLIRFVVSGRKKFPKRIF